MRAPPRPSVLAAAPASRRRYFSVRCGRSARTARPAGIHVHAGNLPARHAPTATIGQPSHAGTPKGSPLDNLAGATVTDLRGFVLVRKRHCAGTPIVRELFGWSPDVRRPAGECCLAGHSLTVVVR
jgi:hypothetical protein